jgi:hypothetical protein
MIIEGENKMLLKSAILLETRKSNKRQNFDYSQMLFDKRIIKAEGIVLLLF